jgi:hypothetical protein
VIGGKAVHTRTGLVVQPDGEIGLANHSGALRLQAPGRVAALCRDGLFLRTIRYRGNEKPPVLVAPGV